MNSFDIGIIYALIDENGMDCNEVMNIMIEMYKENLRYNQHYGNRSR